MAEDDVVIGFGAETRDLEKGVRHIESQLKDLNEYVQGVGEKFKEMGEGLFEGLMVEKLAEIAIEIAEIGAEIDDTSQKLGIGAEELSALGYAANITGGSFGSMTSMLEKLSRSMAMAASGNKAQIAAFKEAGVEYKDASGHLRPLADVMDDLADRFKNAPDGPEKTALAMQLMGRAGADMIPMLNRGSEGLQELKDQAREAGVVLTGEMAHAMSVTAEKVKASQNAFTGLGESLFRIFQPAINAIADGVREFVEYLTHAIETSVVIRGGLEAMAYTFDIVIAAIQGLIAIFEVLWQVADGIIESLTSALADLANVIGDIITMQWDKVGDHMQAALDHQKDNYQKHADEVVKIATQMTSDIATLFASQTATVMSPGAAKHAWGATMPGQGKTPLDAPPAPPAASTPAQNAVKSAIRGLEQLNLSLQDQIATLNMGTAARVAYIEEHKVLNVATAQGIKLTDTQTKKIHEEALAIGEKTVALQHMRDVQNEMVSIAQSITSAFGEWMNGTDSLGHALLKMTLQLAEAVAEAILLDVILSAMGLTALIPTTGIQSIIGPMFGGGHADGGPMSPGKWYIAGERGPEPIWTGGNGAFAQGPNQATGGPSAKEIAREIGKVLMPSMHAQAYGSRAINRSIDDMRRRAR